ncbi:MAG TPA: hypothetical protein VFD77_05115 [Brumimicrobium sp.]|nr:hypothetical protein [Brumimicrobium sp.]
MRKRIPILFILALTLPFIGVYGWLKFEKSAVRKSVKHRLMEGIPKDELIQFTFAKQDTSILLDWKHSKEFEYQGEMYDIVKRYYSDDSVKYDLWWDHEETALNKKLAQLTNSLINQNPQEQSKTNYLAFVNKTMLFEYLRVVLNAPFQKEETLKPFIDKTLNYSSRETEPISPPPQLIV